MGGQSRSNSSCSTVQHPALVSAIATSDQRPKLHSSKSKRSPVSTSQEKTSINNNEDGSFQAIWEHLQDQGISRRAAEVISASWRSSTQQQYRTYIQRWLCFCSERKTPPINPSVNDIIEFLTRLFDNGLGYSALNTARSALSTYFSVADGSTNVTSHIFVKRFLKGIYNLKPSLPKYNNTWDVRLVLEFLKTLSTNDISLRLLSIKLASLLALVTGQRCQTLTSITVDDIVLDSDSVKIRINTLLKQTKPGSHLSELYIEKFSTDENLCVVRTLSAYVQRTQSVRKNKEFFLITQKPHKPASTVQWLRG